MLRTVVHETCIVKTWSLKQQTTETGKGSLQLSNKGTSCVEPTCKFKLLNFYMTTKFNIQHSTEPTYYFILLFYFIIVLRRYL